MPDRGFRAKPLRGGGCDGTDATVARNPKPPLAVPVGCALLGPVRCPHPTFPTWCGRRCAEDGDVLLFGPGRWFPNAGGFKHAYSGRVEAQIAGVLVIAENAILVQQWDETAAGSNPQAIPARQRDRRDACLVRPESPTGGAMAGCLRRFVRLFSSSMARSWTTPRPNRRSTSCDRNSASAARSRPSEGTRRRLLDMAGGAARAAHRNSETTPGGPDGGRAASSSDGPSVGEAPDRAASMRNPACHRRRTIRSEVRWRPARPTPSAGGPMQRSLSVLVLAALCTGCTAMPRTPDHTVLRSLRTIAVIPLAAGHQRTLSPTMPTLLNL